MKEASFYKKSKGICFCQLCPHYCAIEEGKTGKCGVRRNINGKLFSLVFGKPCSMALDPIEKKPFFHFAPGSIAFSVAAVGCNFSCRHCQNWEISQYPKLNREIIGKDVSPRELLRIANKSGARGFSWTYTEPTVFFEYFHETAKLGRGKLFQTWVSNGFTNNPAVNKASKLLDAANIDYKGDDKFYREICGARLEPVLEALKAYRKKGVWTEITNLIIPGHNDHKEHILQMVGWIKDNLGKEVPLHFSSYHPDYKMQAPKTSVETLEKAVKIADEYLDYVYVGNVFHERESTYCPKCREIAIRRRGFSVLEFNLIKKKEGFFCKCGKRIPLAGMKWSPFL